MDIDAGPSAHAFGSAYPLPFRVLFLSFSTLFGFATNLHLLSYLGIDTAQVLDIRLDDYRNPAASSLLPRGAPAPFVHPSRLYPPLYALSALGIAWTTLGWLAFARITGGDPEQMSNWRAVPAFVALVVGGAAVAPWNVLYRRERMMFMRALRRTILSGLYSAVPFSDIILADILTSSAKVLGDVWVSGCLLFTATERFGMGGNDAEEGCARVWMVPVVISLPYIFRFRQCLSEVFSGSTPTPSKSLANAAKYATAFPVIIFSAMQSVVGDIFEGEREGGEHPWIGRHALFRLWILAVLVNTLYSFWWDVTNDWGLSLLTKAGWSSVPSVSYSFLNPSIAPHRRHSQTLAPGRNRSSLPPPPTALHIPGTSINTNIGEYAPPPSRSQSPDGRPASPAKSFHPAPARQPSRGGHSRAFSTAASPNVSFPFLRPILLLPDPLIYYLAIAIDLILRFTWSLKLSSHLHSIHEVESGIFLMEALEVVRRWMWVYLRLEWEAVRKGGGGSMEVRDGESRLRVEDEVIAMQRRGEYRDGRLGDGGEEEIGLGILVGGEKEGTRRSSVG